MDDIFVDLRAAGLPTPSSRQGRKDLAKQIGFSDKHLDNVMSARKPYGGRLRDTIRGLISVAEIQGHGHEPVEENRPAPLSPFNQVIPDPVVAPVIERAEPAAKHVDPRIYKIFTDPEGRSVVTKVIARFTNHRDADEYVLFLNSQIKRGKEVG